jgi:ribonuclease P protein component
VASKVYPLKRSSNFKEAATEGRKLRLASWLTIHIVDSTDSKNYFGITASRKVGGAVIRNKLKRWVRNSVQTEKWPEKLEAKTVVFVFRPQTSEEFYSSLKYAEFRELFKKLESIK